jgi:uncharacterized protein YceH (UPF0502 family)
MVMITELNAIEARVLGSLVEKSLTTREQYPLTFNALLNACNQKTSRDPVMSLDADSMGKAVQSLVGKGFVERLQVPGSRVPKFRHDIGKLLNSDEPKLTAVITMLFLRGPQTPGEIKGRSERLCEFSSTAEVDGLLQELSSRAENPFVSRLPRQAGQKEARYRELFTGAEAAVQDGAAPAPAMDRLSLLEQRVAALEDALKALSAGPAKSPGSGLIP